jgi:hypothetical protein
MLNDLLHPPEGNIPTPPHNTWEPGFQTKPGIHIDPGFNPSWKPDGLHCSVSVKFTTTLTITRKSPYAETTITIQGFTSHTVGDVLGGMGRGGEVEIQVIPNK